MNDYVVTFQCPDRAGIVHAVAAALLESDSNIVEQAQFTDPDSGEFCQLFGHLADAARAAPPVR